MTFKVIASPFFAKKLSGNGTIEYWLAIDETGKLYAQMKENVVDTDSPGTLTSLFFSVTECAPIRNSDIGQLFGYDESGTRQPSSNNNDRGFLKAVLLDLLP